MHNIQNSHLPTVITQQDGTSQIIELGQPTVDIVSTSGEPITTRGNLIYIIHVLSMMIDKHFVIRQKSETNRKLIVVIYRVDNYSMNSL
jgi:hypothetical protein